MLKVALTRNGSGSSWESPNSFPFAAAAVRFQFLYSFSHQLCDNYWVTIFVETGERIYDDRLSTANRSSGGGGDVEIGWLSNTKLNWTSRGQRKYASIIAIIFMASFRSFIYGELVSGRIIVVFIQVKHASTYFIKSRLDRDKWVALVGKKKIRKWVIVELFR